MAPRKSGTSAALKEEAEVLASTDAVATLGGEAAEPESLGPRVVATRIGASNAAIIFVLLSPLPLQMRRRERSTWIREQD